MSKPLFVTALAFGLLILMACQLPALTSTTLGTATPEVHIPIHEGIPDFGLVLGTIHMDIAGATVSNGFPAGCSGGAPCTVAQAGSRILSVTFAPRDLPAGDMVPYKELPDVRAALEGGATVRYTMTLFDNASQTLTLGFPVPAEARTFGLRWGDLPEVPLNVKVLE